MKNYKYKRGGYALCKEAIERVEITRESEKCVWEKTQHGEYLHKKHSRSETYYDSWDEAHEDLLKHVESILEREKDSVIAAQEILNEVKAMQNPELLEAE